MGGNRLAIIGIDGATWSVLRWLIREEWMPNLKRLLEQGVYGELRSLIPPVTGCAWLALATGLNPGKTGVIDFFKNTGSFVLEPISSADFREKSVWDYLSVLGYKVAVLDYPMLYPAYPVNGMMLCSWGSELSAYPRSIIDTIRSIVGEYKIFVDYHLEKYDDIELFLSDLDKAVKSKLRVSEHFMGKSWDLFIDVFSFTDWLQHRMWHYIDSSHPLYPGDTVAFRYRKRFAQYWQLLDEYVGKVAEIYDNILLVSDHGFGPQWGVFNLARWALKHKLSIARTNPRYVVLETFRKILRKTRLGRLIPKRLRVKAHKLRLVAPSSLLYFDLDRSLFIIPEYTIPFGAIHINPKLLKFCKRDRIIEIFVRFIENLSYEINKELKVTVWRKEELYSGDKVDFLPDIIFTINDWSCVIIKDPMMDFVYKDYPYSPRHTGSHRLNGIFIAYGSYFKKGVHIGQISILDVAPTVLYMFNAPIPNTIDGKILQEILRSKATIEPKYVPPLYYRIKFAKARLKDKRPCI